MKKLRHIIIKICSKLQYTPLDKHFSGSRLSLYMYILIVHRHPITRCVYSM